MVTPTGSEELAATSKEFDVSWGKGFKLQIFSKSVYPCSGAGVLAAYETPSCVKDDSIPIANTRSNSVHDEDGGNNRAAGVLHVDNRIRVFGRAKVGNVTAVVAPTRLVYVGEKNIRGVAGGSVAFDCGWFTEEDEQKYVEYCFVIANIDEQGAVADVVTECIPTYPPAGKHIPQIIYEYDQ
jgi:hypothetical protein